MFTGIIEELGKLAGIQHIPGGKRLKFSAKSVLSDAKIGDSISVNGVCLTVSNIELDSFTAEAVGETLKKSTLDLLKPGTVVNLERALRLSDRLGGHIVLGHVNGIGQVSQIRKLGDNYHLVVNLPTELRKFAVPEGSIAVDGISLTIAHVQNGQVTISVIPHTFAHTNLQSVKTGQAVNIETDILARYMEGLLGGKDQQQTIFSESWFRERGY